MSARRLRWLAIIPILAIVLALAVSSRSSEAGDGIVTNDLSGSLTPEDLVNGLVGGGVTVSNVSYTGDDVAAGTFSNAIDVLGAFDAGVVLSTGNISFVQGPNTLDDATAQNGEPGDAQLGALSGFTTFDAAVLEFDFVPLSDTAAFRFVFASEEYNEWVNSQYNDVFAFFVNQTNCAIVPGGGQPITINTINNGTNPSLYEDNEIPGNTLDTEMDGLTVTLTCLAFVNPGVTNHIKMAIADAGDDQLDSVVFIQANSLVGSGPGDPDCNALINSVDALFALRFAASLPVSAQCMPNADVNCSGGVNSVDALLILRFVAALPVTLPPGCPPIGSGPATPTPSATP
jgi:hypothetical protein